MKAFFLAAPLCIGVVFGYGCERMDPKATIPAAVAFYCAQPEPARLAIREWAAKKTAPNSLEIHCQ